MAQSGKLNKRSVKNTGPSHSLSGSVSIKASVAVSALRDYQSKLLETGRKPLKYIDDTCAKIFGYKFGPGRQLGQSPYDENDEPYLSRIYELELDAEKKGEHFSVIKAARIGVEEIGPFGSEDCLDLDKTILGRAKLDQAAAREEDLAGEEKERTVERLRKRYPKWKSNKVGE